MKLSTLPLLSLLAVSVSAGNVFQKLAGARQTTLASEGVGSKVPGDNPLSYCASDLSQDILTIESVDLGPNPPVPGQPLTIEATGYLHGEVGNGSFVEVCVKYGLITLIREKVDICKHVGEVDLECPIDKGKLVLTKEVDIPKQVPPGKYTVFANAVTALDEPIVCLTGSIVFPR